MKEHYYLGCPVWACERWKGQLYTTNAVRSEWLPQYSQVFSTVEGNSVFYHLPNLETARRWSDSVSPGFRFALKFPRVITHEKRLRNATEDTRAFLEVLDLLHQSGCLGTCWLQLPPGFAPHQLPDLKTYLDRLPRHLSFAVELRQPVFFRPGPAEQELNELLEEREINRVILDSRPLFSAPPEDPSEVISQSRKPRLPICYSVTGSHPFVRLIGRNNLPQNSPWLASGHRAWRDGSSRASCHSFSRTPPTNATHPAWRGCFTKSCAATRTLSRKCRPGPGKETTTRPSSWNCFHEECASEQARRPVKAWLWPACVAP